MLKGQCNCGSISFVVTGPVRSVSACHCGQCRTQSGGVWHSAVTEVENIAITGEPRWFRSSGIAQRGFCPTCGAFLFWRHDRESTMSFALGSLSAPTQLTLEKHIFTADKGDYYHIADDVLQEEQEDE
ncbi:MAG: GFA family protein [Roseobacter sp.]